MNSLSRLMRLLLCLMIIGAAVTGASGGARDGAAAATPTADNLRRGGISVQPESAHSWLVTFSSSDEQPAVNVWLGLPTLAGVRVEEISAESPSPPDAPSPRIHLDPLGQIAGQPVARLRLAAGSAPLRARVSWPAAPLTPPRPLHPALEALLARSLVNYPLLDRPTPITTAPTAAPPTHHSQSLPALKLFTADSGLYQLTYDDLVNAGFDPAAGDPRLWQLRQRGHPVAITVAGEDDGAFDPGDSLRFYGEAYVDLYTDENVYWLTKEAMPGLRMTPLNGAPGAAPIPADFPATLHAEEDTAYWNTMPNGAGQDHWFWGPRLSPNTAGLETARDYRLTLHNPSPTAAGLAVRVQLKGYTGGGHRSRLYLNGVLIADAAWSGQVVSIQAATADAALLIDGDNLLTVEAAPSDEPVDQFLVNWLELDYFDTYAAENDQLFLGPPAAGAFKFTLTGFTTADPLVYDITNPAAAQPINQAVVSPFNGGYQLQFERPNTAASRYLALTPTQIKTRAHWQLDTPSDWRTPAHGADYIVITPHAFMAAAEQLAAHRAAQGLRTAVVDVADIYDEFNDGFFSPEPVRDFLAYAYENWGAPPPAYVVLLGDGYGDYKDNLQTGTANYVPPKLVETATFGQVPSDNWFAAVAGDDILPDMLIGRLSAESADQAQIIVDKVVGYDSAESDQPWNRNVLLVADDDDPIFETISDQLAAQTPFTYTTPRVNAADYPPGNPTSDIQAGINAGAVLVNYTGHGEFFRWGQWDNNGVAQSIFSLGDIDALTNSDRLPFITIGNCLNGFFSASSANISLAEALQRAPGKGAVAVWAAASLGYPSGHQELLNDYYTAVFRDDLTGLGAGVTAAKLTAYAQSAFWGEMVETFTLFGDPATQLNIPANYPYVVETTPADAAINTSISAPITIHFNKRMAPGSVTLTGGGITYVPVWNLDNTVVAFNHTEFPYLTQLTLTVAGQDLSGAPLGPGPVPATWSFTTARQVFQAFLPVGLRR